MAFLVELLGGALQAATLKWPRLSLVLLALCALLFFALAFVGVSTGGVIGWLIALFMAAMGGFCVWALWASLKTPKTNAD